MKLTKEARKLIGKIVVEYQPIREEELRKKLNDATPELEPYEYMLLLWSISKAQKEEESRKHRNYRPLVNDLISAWKRWDNESFHRVIILEAYDEDEALAKVCGEMSVNGRSCRCAHDCCGHFFERSARAVTVIPSTPFSLGRYAIIQHGGINV